MKRLSPLSTVPLGERIDARIMPLVETGCWIWLGSVTPGGYATFKFKRKTYAVHRYQYERYVGPIPEGLTIDHVRKRGCASKLCINPAHLEPVTSRENILRGNNRAAHQARQTHCLRGHPLSGEGSDVYVAPGSNRRQCLHCRRIVRARPSW